MLLEQDLIPFQVSPLPPSPWLVFAPHPDDETFGMGGALLLAKENRIPVTLVVLTDGRLGGGDDAALVEAREHEARAAAERLGIQTIDFWREPDRDLRPAPALVAKIGELLKQAAPATVFFPSPMEYHPDHRVTARSVWEAAGRAGFQGKLWAYEISTEGRVDRLIDITAVAEAKRDLMAVYRSQLAENDYPDKIMGLNRARTYSLPAQVRYAEGFYDFTSHGGRPFAEAVYETLTPYWRGAVIESEPDAAAPAAEPEVQPPSPAWEADKAPLVSIIVRTKDRPRLLGEALDSLAAQTYPNLEVIVVNDGGEDVADAVQAYRPRFAALHYHDLQPGRGRSAAGNAGLEKASGEFLGFLDDDDWLLPGHVSLLAAALLERPEKAAYSDVRCLQKDNGEWREVHVFNQPFDRLRLCCNNYLPIHGVLFERSLLKSGCRLDEAFPVYEDWDFWMQVAEQTDFYHCSRVTACYRLLSQGGFGIRPDGALQQEGVRRLLAKWQGRWSVETLQRMLEEARRGLDQAVSEERIRQLEQALREVRETQALTRAHANNLNEVVQHQEKTLARQEAQHQRLDEELRLTRAHAGNLEQSLQSARRERHQLRQALSEREQRILDQENMIAQWRGAYEATLASSSWRVTAPLRAFSRAARRFARLYRHRRHRIRLQPANDLQELASGRYRGSGPDPHFQLRSDRDRLPHGWVWIEGKLSASGPLRPVLYVDGGDGFTERDSFSLGHLHHGERLRGPVRLPERVQALRLDPGDHAGTYLCDDFSMREIGVFQAGAFFVRLRLKGLSANPPRWRDLAARAWSVYRHQGILGLKLALTAPPRSQQDYDVWLTRFDYLGSADISAIREHIGRLARKPKISVLMPVYNPPENWLRGALESVLGQLYPNWELCIADDASTASHVRRVLEEYRRRDARIKVVYREENGHIAAASNSALAQVSGEYVALMDHDDELAPHALYWVAVEIDKHPDAALIYSDEDKIDAEGKRYDPYFKPDWNPLLLCGQNYLSHLSVYRTECVREAGGFRQGVEGSQDWDLALRVSERLKPGQIRHIPYVLYHWRAIPGSTALATGEKQYVREASVRVVRDHFQRCGEKVAVKPWLGGFCRIQPTLPDPAPRVSLVVPTRNGGNLLRRCLDSVLEKTDYPDFELLVVDNQSDAPETLRYLESLAEHPQVRVLRYDAPFNFSAINNFAAGEASGELLGFVNDDVEVISPHWLREMAAYAVRPEVGAVGAKLYYPDERIQHAGVILGLGGIAGHAWWGMPRNHPGQFGRNLLPQFLAAVTAACLVVRRQVFEQVGGFDEGELAVAFNDVDLCLKIRQQGYSNVWTPFAELYHHESATRGPEDTAAKQARFQREIRIMQRRWGSLLHRDPSYNPNLTLDRYDFSIADAPRLQKPWFEFAAPIRESAA